ncbi:MAG: B12-binding domain-containing radical SAM protein [Promethearchaeota archaeon]|jgi:magnesium-protoporphyrin IX monomethyl ester (oxidative) cyclase
MILLINPRTSKSPEAQRAFFREPNLGILYLAAILDLNNIPVDILDLEQYIDLSSEELQKVIINKISGYQIFGITSLTNTFHIALDIATTIKNHVKDSYIILGGPHVTFMYKEILEEDKKTKNIIDFICIGEAERSFLNLIKILISHKSTNKKLNHYETKLLSVGGIAFFNSEGKLKVNHKILETELETLPLPARYKLNHEYYYYTVANVIVNRGCPNQCSFCSRQKLFKKTKIRSVPSILSEIRDILSMQTYNYINFYDNINIDDSFFKDFCSMFIEHKIKISWGCEIRVDNIKEEDARLLKDAGCKLIATGIESASIEVLQKNFKYQDPHKVVEGIENLKEYQIPIQAYFVLGLPGETEETFHNTVNYIKKLPLDEDDTINYFIATPYPGSRLWDDKDNFRINIFEKDFKNYDCEHLIFETQELSISKLGKLYSTAKKLEDEFNKI